MPRSKLSKRIAKEFTEYENSGSSAWNLTLDVPTRPEWLKELGRIEMTEASKESMCAGCIARVFSPSPKIQPLRKMNSEFEGGIRGLPQTSSIDGDTHEL